MWNTFVDSFNGSLCEERREQTRVLMSLADARRTIEGGTWYEET